MADVLERLRTETENWPAPAPDFEAISRRSRVVKRQRIIRAVAVTALAAALVAVASRSTIFEGAPLQPAGNQDQAASAAVLGVAEAGLIEPKGIVYDYEGIERDGDTWLATYERLECYATSGRICERTGERGQVRLANRDGAFEIVDATGAFSEQERAALSSVQVSLDGLPRFDVPARFLHLDEAGNVIAVRAWQLWTGPIPAPGYYLRCQVIGVDASGKDVYSRPLSGEGMLPNSEAARDGNTPWVAEVPSDRHLADARFECGTFRWETLAAVEEDRFETAGSIVTVMGAEITSPISNATQPVAVKINYEYRWAEDYPGIHKCTWTVADAAGKVVGRVSVVLAAWSRRSGPGPHQLVDVDRAISRVSLHCDEQRIDDPNGSHDLTIDDFKIIDESGVAVSYQATWQGNREEGGSECSVEFLAEDGTMLFESEKFEIIGAGRQATEGKKLTIPGGVTGEAATARGICRPWGMTEG